MTFSAWLSAEPAFPQRTLVLAPSRAVALAPGAVRVSENGSLIRRLTVTAVTSAPPGAVGVAVAVDRGASTAGAPLAAEMAGARELAALRRPGQLLAALSFDGAPTTLFGPTAASGEIGRALAATPLTGSGDDPAAAVLSALGLLRAARVTLGVVVVISDGADLSTRALARARAMAAADATPVIAVDLRDGAPGAPGATALGAAVPGQVISATASQLPSLLASVQAAVDRDFLVSWRSQQPRGRLVHVSASVAGLPGSVASAYLAPAAGSSPMSGPGASGPAAAGPGGGAAGPSAARGGPSAARAGSSAAGAGLRASSSAGSPALALRGLSGATPLSATPGFASASAGGSSAGGSSA
ncbi:MAG TPA: hypothetical protein VKV27_08035, partial [Solirubrobacteraceae bacterium]|nr:hypothetical protein [Solirubrobacteraceae bacterium]